MQLKCIAIDDEPLALDIIKAYCSRMPLLNLTHTFDDAVTASEFLRNQPVDLVFLDVNMPDITGIDLARALEKKPMIIFTTAYKKFAWEGFELDAIDYLLKPISFDRFEKAVNKAADYKQYREAMANNQREAHLFVRAEYRLVKIPLHDVEYIEGLEDYIRIHLKNTRPVMTLMTLKSMMEKLPADKFMRIHRSYIIGTDHIQSIQQRKILTTSAKELPISESYLPAVQEWAGLHR